VNNKMENIFKMYSWPDRSIIRPFTLPDRDKLQTSQDNMFRSRFQTFASRIQV